MLVDVVDPLLRGAVGRAPREDAPEPRGHGELAVAQGPDVDADALEREHGVVRVDDDDEVRVARRRHLVALGLADEGLAYVASRSEPSLETPPDAGVSPVKKTTKPKTTICDTQSSV